VEQNLVWPDMGFGCGRRLRCALRVLRGEDKT